jgi:hypothetical protein
VVEGRDRIEALPASLERQAALLSRLLDLEPLWSPVAATRGDRSQILRSNRRQKTSEYRCRRLRPVAEWSDGKEEVDGSSPSEGSRKSLQFGDVCVVDVAHVGDEGRTGPHPASSLDDPLLTKKGIE